jgi:hypothetical protein
LSTLRFFCPLWGFFVHFEVLFVHFEVFFPLLGVWWLVLGGCWVLGAGWWVLGGCWVLGDPAAPRGIPAALPRHVAWAERSTGGAGRNHLSYITLPELWTSCGDRSGSFGQRWTMLSDSKWL